MKAIVGAFNQEKALVGAFSVIVQPVVEPMDRFAALNSTVPGECVSASRSVNSLLLIVFLFRAARSRAAEPGPVPY